MKHRFPLLFLHVILFLGFAKVFAHSELQVQMYPTPDKLSQSKISSFVQDDNGYIWFGTWDGLTRFDGQHTQIYKTYPGDSVRIENHRIMKILKSPSGHLWVTNWGQSCYFFDTQRNCFLNPLADYGNKAQLLYSFADSTLWTYQGGGKFLRIKETGQGFQITPYELPFSFTHLFGIEHDYLGQSWILTDQGAYIIERKQRIGNLPCRHMASSQGEVYLASTQQFYHCNLEQGTLDPISIPINREIDRISTLTDGTIAICQWSQVVLYNPLDRHYATFAFQANILRYLYEDSQQRLWLLGNENEVFLLDRRNPSEARLSQVTYDGHPVPSTTASFQIAFEDDFGRVWVQPGNSLPLAAYNEMSGHLEQAYTYTNGRRRLLSVYIRSGAIDQQHNLWGNIDEVGFCYFSFRPQSYNFVGGIQPSGIATDRSARALLIDKKQRLWIGWKRDTRNDEGNVGLYNNNDELLGYMSPNGTLVQQPELGLLTNVFSLLEDRRGRIWMGTRTHGLYILDPLTNDSNSFHIYHYLPKPNNAYSLSGRSIYDLLEDHLGRIWIASYGNGLDVVENADDLSQIKFHHFNNFPNNHKSLRCLLETREHQLLLGSNNGLLISNIDQLTQLPDTLPFTQHQCTQSVKSLSSNSVMHLNQLVDGRIVIATFGGGLNTLPAEFTPSDTLSFQHYNSRQSALPDVILSTSQDAEGNLWVVAENGLLKYNEQFKYLGTFLEDTPCSEARPIHNDQRHIFYLASKYDVLCFNQSTQELSDFVPPIVFSNYDIHQGDNTYRHVLTPSDTIVRLQANERNFSLQFVSLDYSGPANIQYAYKLLPAGTLNRKMAKRINWTPLQNSANIHMLDVKAGKYKLEVKSTNADGVWCNNTRSLTLVIEPYFYETLWFQILCWCLIACSAGYALYYYLKKQEKKRQSLLASQLAEAKVQIYQEVTQRMEKVDEKFMQLLIEYIEENLSAEDFSIEQAATQLNTSYAVLYRKVKQALDIAPADLVKQLRIKRARQLLSENPELTASEVGYRCGFNSPQYFSRVFKDNVGQSPLDFRKQCLKDKKEREVPK